MASLPPTDDDSATTDILSECRARDGIVELWSAGGCPLDECGMERLDVMRELPEPRLVRVVRLATAVSHEGGECPDH